jgi:hypothetical protein
MNKKRLWLIVSVFAVLILAPRNAVLAQSRLPQHLSGIISDYTPLIPTLTPTGPWEMRGHWSMNLNERSGKADFTAYITMELSDSGVAAAGANLTDPKSRSPHTHHIVMTDATFSQVDTSTCPGYSPANTALFAITGTAKFISGNGNSAPFEKLGPTMLQVCISGGTDGESEVRYSNMSLVMTGPAADKHFGPQPIHGVVRLRNDSEEGDNDDQHRH